MRLFVVALVPCPEEPNIDLHQILHFWFMFSAEVADSPKPRFRRVWIASGLRMASVMTLGRPIFDRTRPHPRHLRQSVASFSHGILCDT